MNLATILAVLESEKSLAPVLPSTQDEIESLTSNIEGLAKRLGYKNTLHSATLVGSLSRNSPGPYSDIDIEAYSSDPGSFQGFCKWNKRLLTFFAFHDNDIYAEAHDPCAAIWMRSQIEDAKILFDERGFVSSLKKIFCAQPILSPGRSEDLIFSSRITKHAEAVTESLQERNYPVGLKDISRYMENVGWYYHLRSGTPIKSESDLAATFTELVGDQNISDLRQGLQSGNAVAAWNKCHRLVTGDLQLAATPLYLAPEQRDTPLSWENQKAAFRRIIEYRRKIYNLGEINNLSKDAFALFALGRLIENSSLIGGMGTDKSLPHLVLDPKTSYTLQADEVLHNTCSVLRRIILPDRNGQL